MNDYQVGYSFVPFKGPSGHYAADGGTVLFSNDIRVRNSVRNSDTIFKTYGPHAARIDALVAAANATLDPPPAEATYSFNASGGYRAERGSPGPGPRPHVVAASQ